MTVACQHSLIPDSATMYSPHPASILPHHGRARLAVERLLKLGHVGDYAVGAVLLRRVRVDRGAQTLGFVTLVGAPALSVGDEEALLGCKVVDRLQVLALRVSFPGHVSKQQAPEIGYVLAERQLPVDLDLVNNRVAGILVGDATCALLEVLCVLRCP